MDLKLSIRAREPREFPRWYASRCFRMYKTDTPPCRTLQTISDVIARLFRPERAENFPVRYFVMGLATGGGANGTRTIPKRSMRVWPAFLQSGRPLGADLDRSRSQKLSFS